MDLKAEGQKGTLSDGAIIPNKGCLSSSHNPKSSYSIDSVSVPSGIVSEALEIWRDGSIGYVFTILSDFGVDLELAKAKLITKIKKGLNQWHLIKKRGRWEIGAKQKLRGRIQYNDDYNDTEQEKVFIIDGHRITFEEFVRLLEPYEGYSFEFKIVDRCD